MVKGRQGERVKLYIRGMVLRYKRSKSNQYPRTSLIQIGGVNTREEVAWYVGKCLAFTRSKMKLTTDAFGARFASFMVTVAIFELSSSQTFAPKVHG